MPVQTDVEQILKSSSPGISERINCNEGSRAGNDVSLSSGDVRPSVLVEIDSVGIKSRASGSPAFDETRTPLAIITSSCDTEDWHLVTGEKSSSVKKPCKFKRLRKVGDVEKNENMEIMERTSVSTLANIVKTFSSTRQMKKKKRDGIFSYSSIFGESLSVPNIVEDLIEHTLKKSNFDLVANCQYQLLCIGERRFDDNARAFIEEEAE